MTHKTFYIRTIELDDFEIAWMQKMLEPMRADQPRAEMMWHRLDQAEKTGEFFTVGAHRTDPDKEVLVNVGTDIKRMPKFIITPKS